MTDRSDQTVRARALEIVGAKLAKQHGYPEHCFEAYAEYANEIVTALENAELRMVEKFEHDGLRQALRRPMLDLLGQDSDFCNRTADTFADAALPTIAAWGADLLAEINHLSNELEEAGRRVGEIKTLLRFRNRQIETTQNFWVQAAKGALAGQPEDLRKRVALAEAGPVRILASDAILATEQDGVSAHQANFAGPERIIGDEQGAVGFVTKDVA